MTGDPANKIIQSTMRESLGSRLGFIFLAAGCAIGLGNVWRFPFIAGKYGGAAFVLVYLVFLILLGLPVMVMEFSVGRASRRNIGLAFKTLEPRGSKWHFYGPVGIAGNYLLMMFYTTVTGWILYYLFSIARGKFVYATPESTQAFFTTMLGDPATMTLWMVVTVFFGFLITSAGLRAGVERITKILMALLLLLMLALAVHSMTLPGGADGIRFYLLPDFGRLVGHGAGEVVFAAMGQAFFTLSLGIGAMTIFGSYIGKERSLTGESVRIIGLDTFVAIVSGLIIFPACFAFGVNPGAGPGLLFVTLPNIFMQMPGGRFWGSIFFLFMSFAALSTVIAVFENIISYWMDTRGTSRKKASWLNCAAIIALSLPCVFGFNLLAGFEPLGAGTNILDLEDFIVSATLLPIGVLVFIFFTTMRYGWGWSAFIAEANTGKGLQYPSWAKPYTRFVLPLIIIIVFIKGYWDIFMKG